MLEQATFISYLVATESGEGWCAVAGGCLRSVAWWLGCCWRDWVVLVVVAGGRAAEKRSTGGGEGWSVVFGGACFR
jgi:hypothetical protein